jgi:hypothetical protein
MGRGILLWLLGVPIPDYHPSGALLALTDMKPRLHRRASIRRGGLRERLL